MRHIPIPHEIYRHFKGNLYQIVTLAEHTESGEKLVVYQALYGEFKTYARPLSMFMERVDTVKYPNAGQEYRFEPVNTGDSPESETKAADKRQETDQGHAAGNEPETDQGGAEPQEIPDIDPMVMEFLDASAYEERLNILAGLHHRITDDMINVMAMATDIEIKPGDIEERYTELRSCLMTLERFECNRLR